MARRPSRPRRRSRSESNPAPPKGWVRDGNGDVLHPTGDPSDGDSPPPEVSAYGDMEDDDGQEQTSQGQVAVDLARWQAQAEAHIMQQMAAFVPDFVKETMIGLLMPAQGDVLALRQVQKAMDFQFT